MGNSQSITKINYEDMQNIINKPEFYLIINTLPNNEQNCLIFNTVNADNEENDVNTCLKENKNTKIVIYGKNSNDETVQKKVQQLTALGFNSIYIYSGGLFEWLLLQDIYGTQLFPTTSTELDILKYKSPSLINIRLLKY
jgi:rhodanese-related sulfurtransferase